MERFIKVTKAKLLVILLSTILPILVISILPPILTKHFKIYADIMALRYVLVVIVEAVLIWKSVHYIRIIKNEEYAKSAFVKQHDERINFVKMKSGVMSIKITLYVLAVVTVVFGFIDRNVFYTLFAVLTFIVIIMVSTSLYYKKKY